LGGIFLFGYARQEALGEHPMYTTLLFTGVGIFLSGYAGQEASGIRPMWKTGQKQSYKPA